MSTTLSYGFIIPKAGEKGPTVFPALEANIQRLNDHNHDGVNSAPISAFQIKSAQSAIPASAWQSYGGPIGQYRQLVTMAPGYTFDTSTMSFRTLAGQYVYPSISKADQTSFYIYSNDPTVGLVVNYGG